MTDPIRANLSTSMGRQAIEDNGGVADKSSGYSYDAVQDFALIDTQHGTVTVSDGENVVWTGAAKDVGTFNPQIASDIYGTCIVNGVDVPVPASNARTTAGGGEHKTQQPEHPAQERTMRRGGN